MRSDGPDRLAHDLRLGLVRAEIIEDHDLAGLEGRDEELFSIGQKALAIDGAVERTRRVVAQGGDESRGQLGVGSGLSTKCKRRAGSAGEQRFHLLTRRLRLHGGPGAGQTQRKPKVAVPVQHRRCDGDVAA